MKTSTLICKLHGFTDYESYRAHCSCSYPLHSQDITISVESDAVLSVTIASTLRHCNYKTEYGNVFKRVYNRLKSAIKILFTGSVEVETEYIFQSRQHVEDYINALKTGIENVEKNLPTVSKGTG